MVLNNIVKLASNENPFGASHKVVSALKEAVTHFAIISRWICNKIT